MDSESLSVGSPATTATPNTNAQGPQQGEAGTPVVELAGDARSNGTFESLVAIGSHYDGNK